MSGFKPTAEVARQRIPGGDEGDVVTITAGAFHGSLGSVPAFQLRRSDLGVVLNIYFTSYPDAHRWMERLLGQLAMQERGRYRLDRMADLLG